MNEVADSILDMLQKATNEIERLQFFEGFAYFLVGYISVTPQYSDMHPDDVLEEMKKKFAERPGMW